MTAVGRLREWLEDGSVHLMDGALGTVLYQRGVFVNVCYDELNLSQPDLVLGVHADYVRAGSELIETNTFGANPVKLSTFGLESRTEEINEAAARLAVRAAGGSAVVLGSIGPLGIRIEPWGPTSVDEATAFFARQAAGLAAGGVGGFVLETFSDMSELLAALRAVRQVSSDRPAFAQMSFGEDLETAYGTTVEQMARTLDATDADVIGLNCSVGPTATLDAVEILVTITDRPISALPNAGLPRNIGDRKIYMASPEYMARYALRMADAGARFLGGCCGTTAEHVRHMAAHLKTARPPQFRVVDRASGSLSDDTDDSIAEEITEQITERVPLAECSDLGARLKAREFVRGIELAPPRGWAPTPLVDVAQQARLAGFHTVHILDGPARRTRMHSLAAARIVEREAEVETVAHYSCRDRNMLGMVGDLLGAAASGLRNVLLITGDPPRGGPYDSGGAFDIDSIGLTNVVQGLNLGLDPGGESIGQPTRFVIGVAVNHTAPDLDAELHRFAWKVDAGADFAVTQPVFDPVGFLAFLERLETYGVPILAGLWPPLSLRNTEFLAHEVPGIVVPPSVLARMKAAADKGPEAEAQEGVALVREVYEQIADSVAGVVVSCPGNLVERATAAIGLAD